MIKVQSNRIVGKEVKPARSKPAELPKSAKFVKGPIKNALFTKQEEEEKKDEIAVDIDDLVGKQSENDELSEIDIENQPKKKSSSEDDSDSGEDYESETPSESQDS